MTISIDEIIKESIYRKSQGEDISTENILSEALKGISKKELVNIYKENELTPRQRYMQRKEETVKQFDLARQEEIKSTLAYAHSQIQVNNNMVSNIENQEQLDTTSIRR